MVRRSEATPAASFAGVDVLDALDADAVRRWSRTAVEQLTAHRDEIDALNVFPIDDSDTGSNMLHTVSAGDAALRAAVVPDAAAALAALAGGAALAATGNSGFIVSQVLRGLADAASDGDRCDAAVVARGLDRGATLARAAVVSPVEGTILTVARAAADAAVGSTLGETVTAAVVAADAALQATTAQLAELARYSVVDAGGRGLVVLLAALVEVVTGARPTLSPVTARVRKHDPSPETRSAGFGFEVQYLLDAPSAAVEGLRDRLAHLGDSVAVVSVGAQAWNVHVHVDDVGAAIEAGVEAGRAHHIAVVRFTDGDHHEPHRHGEPGRGPSAVLAVAPGDGVAHLFGHEGVHVVDGTDGDLPSVAEVVDVIVATGARNLVLLPNASRVTGVAEAAAAQVRDRGLRVSVVPTRSPVQGLAAIAVHDATRRFDDDVVAMAEAAAATRYAELTIADAEALTAVGICQAGDVLGLIDGEVVEIGRGMLAVAFGLVDRLLGVGAELMTVLVGAGAPVRIGELIAAHVRERAPFTDVTVYQGGQRDHPVIIGVE